MPEETSTYDENYILQKQLSHELYSPEYVYFNENILQNIKKQKAQFTQDLMQRGKSSKEAQAATGGLEEPAIDPVSAGTGGAAGTFKTAIQKGSKILPSLFRSGVAGGVGAAAEFPIGTGTAIVEEKYPALALPFTAAVGFLSAATVENAIEKAVVKQLKKANGATTVTKAALKGEAARVKAKLQAGTFDDETAEAVKNINAAIGDLPIKDVVGKSGGVPIEEKFLKLESKFKGEKYAININRERLDTSEDIQKMIDNTAELYEEGIQEARRGKRTFVQTKAAADMLGMTPQGLLKRRKGEAFSAEEALAARRILVSSADNLNALAEKVQRLDATDVDKLEFRRALNTHYAIQAQVSGMTAEAGRSLQQFKIPAGSQQIQVKQIKEMLEAMPGGSVEDLAAAITSIDTIGGINTFVRQAQKATTSDMLLEAWINGLLSGPQTHAVNTLSNSLVGLWQIPERFLATGISKILQDDAVGAGEGFTQAFGMIQGAKDGLKAFGKVLSQTARLKEVIPEDELSKLELRNQRAITAQNIAGLPIINKISPNALEDGGPMARFVDYMGEAIRTPGKLLVGEDDFFKAIGYRMELNARAYRRATLEEGLSGQDAALRIQEIINNPQEFAPDIHLASIDAARYQTFTRPLGEGGKALQKFLNAHPLGRIIMPFVRTPTNILKFAGERTPLAWVSQNVRNEIMAGGARRDLALAKMAMGSMAMAAVGSLVMEGKITGNGPSNPDMRSIKYNTGWKPYSIKVGNKYYSYNRLEPLGMVFGMASDFVEIAGNLNENERDELATAIVSAISQNITSKTWLRGLSEALTAFDDPQRYGAKWWQNLAGTVVPTGVAQVERVMSPEMSAVNSTMDSIKSRIPGYSDGLPPRRNLWGEPIAPEGGLGPDIISPIYTSTQKLSPIDEELLNLNMPIKMPSQTQNFDGVPIKLTPKEYDRFLVLMNQTPLDSTGKKLKQSLDELVKDPDYAATRDPELKEYRIRSLLTEARFIARQQLKDEFEILRHIVIQEQERKEALQ